jgi:hypothetical protein
MKFRNGFVSNSSSSSFFIAVAPNEGAEDRDTAVRDALGIAVDAPAAKLFKGLIKFLAGGRLFDEERFLKSEGYKTREAAESGGALTGNEGRALMLAEQGWRVREQTACNDSGDSTEALFYETDLKIDTPQIKIFG